jgi:hypothetical protein
MVIQKKRRVEYRTWTNEVYILDSQSVDKHRSDWGFTIKYGWFVEYGLALYDVDSPAVSYSVAIIENEQMGVELVHPENIKFLP